MKRKFFPFAVLALGLAACSILITGCSNEPEGNTDVDNPINIELTRSEAQAVDAVNDFAFDLLKNTNKQYSNIPNYNVSPMSAAWVLSMLANGAADGSETMQELIDVLKLGQGASLQDVNEFSKKLIEAVTKENISGKVNVANILHHKKEIDILSHFSDKLKTFYDAGIMESPTNQTLDNWISDKTDGNITGFAEKHKLADYDFGLLNTLYFEGYWEKELDKNSTQPRIFHNFDGTQVKTLMMRNTDQRCKIGEDNVCYLVKNKFKNGYFAINFLVPKDGNKLDEVIEHMDGEKWQNLSETSNERLITLIMPKPDISTDFDLIDIMKNMGVTKIFDEKNDELSEISDKPMVIKLFDQATTFVLDEKGAKAAVVTSAAGMTSANFEKKDIITLDEPFCYFITEESTGAILFAGKVSHFY